MNLISKNLAGRIGEWITIILYSLQLYRVVAYRKRIMRGEIDIIVSRCNTIVFIEVKTTNGTNDDNFNYPAVRLRQQRSIIRTATLFLQRNKRYENYDKRFDLVLISRHYIPRVIKNIW